MVRALCSGHLNLWGQLQRQFLKAGGGSRERHPGVGGAVVLVESFSVVLDGFLVHLAPFKFFWKIDSGFRFQLEAIQFLGLFQTMGKDQKHVKILGQALLSWRVFLPTGGSPVCFCGIFRLNLHLLQRSSGLINGPD